MTIGKTNYKMGVKSYFKPTPEKIKRLLLSVKTLVGVVAGSEYFAGNHHAALLSLVVGWAVTELAEFVTVE